MKKRYMRGSITTYVMLMFGLVVVLFLMGFSPPFFAQTIGGSTQTVSEAGSFDIGTMMMTAVNSVFESIAGDPVWGIIGAAIAFISMAVIVKMGGQYVLAYIIPLILLILFANIFVFPTSSIGGLPSELSLITFSFLNLFLILSYLEFVRGNP